MHERKSKRTLLKVDTAFLNGEKSAAAASTTNGRKRKTIQNDNTQVNSKVKRVNDLDSSVEAVESESRKKENQVEQLRLTVERYMRNNDEKMAMLFKRIDQIGEIMPVIAEILGDVLARLPPADPTRSQDEISPLANSNLFRVDNTEITETVSDSEPLVGENDEENTSTTTCLITPERIQELKHESKSDENFAVLLMCEVFSLDELTDPNVNVTGVARRSCAVGIIQPLDPVRMNAIQEIYFNSLEIREENKVSIWKIATLAMAKKMSALKLAKK